MRHRARRGDLDVSQVVALQAAFQQKTHWQRLDHWLKPLLTEAVRSDDREKAILNTSIWLRRMHQFERAHHCLELLNWRTARGQAFLQRGLVLQQLNQIAAAKKALKRSCRDGSSTAAACYHLGLLHRSTGDFDQAARWLLRSLRRDADPAHVHTVLQYCRCSKGMLRPILRFYQQLHRRYPERALPLQQLSLYQQRQGDLTQARKTAQKAARLELGPRTCWLADEHLEPTPPDFLLLGVPKGGTTSLFAWLCQHPQIWGHPRKELHFFDGDYHLGEAWYCAQFPRFQNKSGILRGEATPNMFSHPEAPARVSRLIPEVKALVLLRDPLDRAVSWVQHLQRLEGLQGSVESWLSQELETLQSLDAKELSRSGRVGTGALQDSLYDLHLQRWRFSLAEPKQLLVISSERLFADPQAQLSAVLTFLGLDSDPEPWMEGWVARNVNPGRRTTLPKTLESKLKAFLQKHCQESITPSDPSPVG
jgi:hypothetical protein